MIRIRDPGGPYIPAFTAAFYAPFTAATGITIERMVGGVEPTGMIRDMVRSGEHIWDMVVVSEAAHIQLVADDCLAPIGVDTPDLLSIEARSPYFVGNAVLAQALAVNRDTYGDDGPADWTGLWDVDRYPGRRCLRRHPMDTMEQALLADGVAPGALYPLDAERAFRALDRLRPAVVEWWPRAIRTEVLMQDALVDLMPASAIRAQAAIEAGARFRIAWDGHMRSTEGWCILRGSPAADECRAFIEFAASAERQAMMANALCVSPTIPRAAELVPRARAMLLPDHHRDQAVLADAAYWSRAKDSLEAWFEAWLTEPRCNP